MRLIRLTKVYEFIKLRYIALAAVVFLLACLILGRSRTDYIAPYTIAMSISLFMLFERYLRFPNWLCRVCSWAAPSMFGVYLAHGPTSFGKMLHMLPLDFLIQNGVTPSIAIVLSALVCFMVCFIIENIRRYSLVAVKNLLGK